MERWIAEFERHLVERRYADATRRAYADELRRFEAFARSRLKRPVAVPRDLTAELIAAFAAARSLERIDARQRNHARTLARSLAAVRGFLRYLERRGESVGEARAGFPRVSLPETLPSALGEAALNALLDGAEVAAKNDPRACRAVAAAECLYGAGLRVGELAGLTRSGLDEKRRLVRVLGKAPASAWCRSGTRAPGAPALLGGARARAGSRRSDHLRPGAGAATTRTLNETFADSWRAWDLTRPAIRTPSGTVSPHLLERGADLRAVQELLDIETSRPPRSTHVTRRRLRPRTSAPIRAPSEEPLSRFR